MTRHRLPLYAAFLLLYLAGDLLGNLLWALTHYVFDFHCLPYPGQVPERILASALAGMLLAVAPAWLWHRWHSRWVAMLPAIPLLAFNLWLHLFPGALGEGQELLSALWESSMIPVAETGKVLMTLFDGLQHLPFVCIVVLPPLYYALLVLLATTFAQRK